MPRVKLYAPACGERYCFSINETVTVEEFMEIVRSRLEKDIEYYNYQNYGINITLRMQDGFEYKIHSKDLVNDIITENDIFIINFVTNSKDIKNKQQTRFEERKVTRLLHFFCLLLVACCLLSLFVFKSQ